MHTSNTKQVLYTPIKGITHTILHQPGDRVVFIYSSSKPLMVSPITNTALKAWAHNQAALAASNETGCRIYVSEICVCRYVFHS